MSLAFLPALLFIPTFLFLNGGSIHHPQMTEEFLLGVPTAFLGSVETFEVDRPHKNIGKTFKKTQHPRSRTNTPSQLQ